MTFSKAVIRVRAYFFNCFCFLLFKRTIRTIRTYFITCEVRAGNRNSLLCLNNKNILSFKGISFSLSFSSYVLFVCSISFSKEYLKLRLLHLIIVNDRTKVLFYKKLLTLLTNYVIIRM